MKVSNVTAEMLDIPVSLKELIIQKISLAQQKVFLQLECQGQFLHNQLEKWQEKPKTIVTWKESQYI